MEIYPNSIVFFFSLWVIIIGLISGFGLWFIWRNFQKQEERNSGDKGFFWLSWSLFTWVLGGGLFLSKCSGLWNNPSGEKWFDFLVATISILNGVFILLALPFFQHKPKVLHLDEILKLSWYNGAVYFVGAAIWVISSCFIAFIGGNKPGVFNPQYIPDVLFAAGTTLILAVILWHTFGKRDIPNLGYLSILVLTIAFVSQALKLFLGPHEGTASLEVFVNGQDTVYFFRYLSVPVYMSLLVMIFFALAYSAVKDNREFDIEQLDINPDNVYLELIPVQLQFDSAKYNLVKLTIPSLFSCELINLSTGAFFWLSALSIAKRNEEEDGFLYAKKNGLVSDYQGVQLNVIFENLVKHFYKEEEYDSRNPKHEVLYDKLRNGLLEDSQKGGGSRSGYRLRIPAEHITSIGGDRHIQQVILKKLNPNEDKE